MLLNTAPADLLVLSVLTISFVALLGYVVIIKFQTRREKRNIALISAALIDYFQRTGVNVSVGCMNVKDNELFTAFIESEPMKQFRLSHIIEITLRDHIYKTCGLELEKVYWRFPIKEVTETSSSGQITQVPDIQNIQDKVTAKTDDYISEGLVHYRHIPKVEVTEIPWEKFQEASSKDGG